MKQETKKIIALLESYRKSYKENKKYPDNYTNHWLRRFFRCYIDGSYKGEHHYKSNISYIMKNKDNKKKMRSFVIGSFVGFIKIEYPTLSVSTIQKIITRIIPSDELEVLNKELIDDSLDLIEGITETKEVLK